MDFGGFESGTTDSTRSESPISTTQTRGNVSRVKALRTELLKSDNDLAVHFDSESTLLYNDGVVFHYPLPDEYRIGIIIDPCRGHENYCVV